MLAGKDVEFGRKIKFEDKDVFINSAAYGYDNCINHLVTVMDDLHITPRQLIFVMEGKNSKADRQLLHPAYKAGRERAPDQYEQFNICKERLLKTFLAVGSQMCFQDGGVEADDVLGYLALNLEGERWIVSGDKDLAVLVNPAAGINHYRRGVVNENPFGDFPHKFITTWIALVGDASDKISGAKGFGEKAGQMLLMAFGVDGLELMEGLITNKQLIKLEEDVDTLKELQRIIDSADSVYLSYELARLRIEKVNTLRRPLMWQAGMVKPREQCEEQALRKYAGVQRIVSAETYADAVAFFKKEVAFSPEVTLDIETSTPSESDDWLESRDKADRVDVFGSELTSLQLCFGSNMQYTLYLPFANVEEPDVSNLSMDQIADFVALIPKHLYTYVHNAAFELPICYMSWGEKWSNDPEFHGFLRNVLDTAIGSSYVNENLSKGLKFQSLHRLGYEQVSYDQVTTRVVPKSEWDGRGKVMQTYSEPIIVDSGETEEITVGLTDHYGDAVKNVIPKMAHVCDVDQVVVQLKMNQLTAREVLAYGADDCICTAALANHFRVIMELEKTWSVYLEVEQFPAYLTALAYVQGTAFSLESMAEQERDDDKAFNEAEPVLHDYLMKIGFEGTRFDPIVELTPAEIKRAVVAVLGAELDKTMVRTPSKLAKLIEMQFEEDGPLLAKLINDGDIAAINYLMEANFTGKPQLDLASPKQMKTLLYDFMKIPVKVINDVTDNERIKNPSLDQAVRKFKKIRAGTSSMTMQPKELELMKLKAKSDDTAIDFAIAFDTDVLDDEARTALKTVGIMKKVMTRRSLFYNNYWKGLHWKDQKMHASTNQCAAVTRRYSMNDQNLTQLPKKGEGVRFRGHFKPHKKNAIVASIDYVGQELRLSAEVSQDVNMLSCYVGENLKDVHSITAAGALKLKWGAADVAECFDKWGEGLGQDTEGTYELFIRLRNLGKSSPVGKRAEDHRKGSKNVNFAAQNGARAVKISETEVIPFEDAQLFLDARSAMFPGVDKAATACAEEAKRLGYATTLMGARRHLQEAMLSDEHGASDRAARQAWNFRIQGSAGEQTKLGMSRMWKRGIYFKYDARFIAPIHDECVSSVTVEHAVDFIREKHDCMAQPYSTMKIPILGSISIGPDFAEQIECGDWFVPERIAQALNDICETKESA